MLYQNKTIKRTLTSKIMETPFLYTKKHVFQNIVRKKIKGNHKKVLQILRNTN